VKSPKDSQKAVKTDREMEKIYGIFYFAVFCEIFRKFTEFCEQIFTIFKPTKFMEPKGLESKNHSKFPSRQKKN
jgi:hypothetical protein